MQEKTPPKTNISVGFTQENITTQLQTMKSRHYTYKTFECICQAVIVVFMGTNIKLLLMLRYRWLPLLGQ